MLHCSVLKSDIEDTLNVFICHGILGSGQNWRSFARQLQQIRPNLNVVLVDLRCHGRSPSEIPPHTVDSCARDLFKLSGNVGSPDVIIGHSFGGKVALAALRYLNPQQVWVLDSPPGPLSDRPEDRHEVSNVISALSKVPMPLKKRSDLKHLLVSSGFSEAIGNWMTTNLKRTNGGYVWRFDLNGVESLIRDYFKQDLWSLIETKQDAEIHLVRAQDSDRWSESIINRLQQQNSTKLHILPRSGHWVHVDNPEGLLEMFNRFLIKF